MIFICSDNADTFIEPMPTIQALDGNQHHIDDPVLEVSGRKLADNTHWSFCRRRDDGNPEHVELGRNRHVSGDARGYLQAHLQPTDAEAT